MGDGYDSKHPFPTRRTSSGLQSALMYGQVWGEMAAYMNIRTKSLEIAKEEIGRSLRADVIVSLSMLEQAVDSTA